MSQDFLVELGTEELPPKALSKLSAAFSDGIKMGLQGLGLGFTDLKSYATPRRLAVLVKDLVEATPVNEVTIWGPPAKVAFDEDGQPTKAALAFAAKNGIDPADLITEHDGKVDKLVKRTQAGGDATVSLLQDLVASSLAKLPIPKRMRWGDNRHEFIRPVHWLVMLYGDNIVDAQVMGLQANRQTYGHRFHYNQALDLQTASDYDDKLNGIAYVVADFEARKTRIRQQVITEAEAIGGQAVIDDGLLEEVTALVEWPVALRGQFEERYLKVPAEALVSSMKEHQKYFHVVDAAGKLMPHFITVANIESENPAQVVDGNERVIRPRLADAAFFFETDQKTTLASKREPLKNIVFQAQLGTVYDKTERVAKLAGTIAQDLGQEMGAVIRAGELCKSDLVSEMVLEFADLQGIAGYYYATHDGEPEEVALAMKEHYLPRFAGDVLPSTETGALIALADRLDTLVGIFAIGQQPTGSKDPFALRRASLGVLRILVEQERDLDLRQLLLWAYSVHQPLPQGQEIVDTILDYMLERLRAWYEEQAIPVAVFQAVSAKHLSKPLDIDQRVQAVNHFRQLPEAEALAAANKRVSNILEKNNWQTDTELDSTLLIEEAEQSLAKMLGDIQATVKPLFTAREYKAALTELAVLRGVVDDFFDQVMVMVDDEALKNNRLTLLQQLRALFLEVADISLLASGK